MTIREFLNDKKTELTQGLAIEAERRYQGEPVYHRNRGLMNDMVGELGKVNNYLSKLSAEQLDRNIDDEKLEEKEMKKEDSIVLDGKTYKQDNVNPRIYRSDDGTEIRSVGGSAKKSEESYILADLARSLKFGKAAKGLSDQVRAITTSSGSAAIQDPHVVDQIILELQSSNQLAEAGADFRQIKNHMQMPKVTEYPAYHWQANEGDEIPVDTALTISSKKWNLKDLAIRVRVSNQYLMDSGKRGRRLVEESMVRQINQAIAQAVFTGTGTSGQPAGIETFSGLQSVNIDPDAAMTDWTQIIEACRLLSSVNVPIDKISAFFSPTGWSQLASFVDTTGQPLGKPVLLQPVRFFNPSTLVLESYDTGTTTKMFLGDFSKLIVGFQGMFTISLDQVRAAHLETEFMVHMRLDTQATHEDNFAQITGILV